MVAGKQLRLTSVYPTLDKASLDTTPLTSHRQQLWHRDIHMRCSPVFRVEPEIPFTTIATAPISGNYGIVWNKTQVTSNLAYAINMIVFMKAVQRDTSQFITKG